MFVDCVDRRHSVNYAEGRHSMDCVDSRHHVDSLDKLAKIVALTTTLPDN